MGMCRVPAVIIAVVIGGAGLSACAASGSPSSTTPSAAVVTTPGAAPTTAFTGTPDSSPTPSASKTQSAVQPSNTATEHPTSSPTSSHPTSSPTDTSSGSGSFTVPAIPGDDVVSASGSYTKIGTGRVKVTICAKQTGTAFASGAIALAYNASGASQNIGATLQNGVGDSACVNRTFLLYTAHLKVHAFIGGSNGTIAKTGPVLTVY
jgi:hypothetical protein